MPAGPALLAATTGAALLPVGAVVHRATAGAMRIHPQVPIAGTAGCGTRSPPRPRRWPTRSPTDIAAHPHDWHMLQRLWLADLPRDQPGRTSSAARGDRMRIGIVCPYSWDIPGGVQAHVRDLAEKLIELGHEVSVLAPGDDDTPAAALRRAGRARRCRPATTARSPGCSSAWCPRPGCGAGCATASSTCVHVHEPAPPSLSLLACMIARRPDRRHLPQLDRPGPRAVLRCSTPSCSRSWRRSAAGSRCRAARPQGASSSTSAATRSSSRTGSRSRTTPSAEPLPGLPARRRHDRLHRPLRRAAQGHARAARRRCPARRRTRPDAAAAGRRPRRRRRRLDRAAAGAARPGRRCSARSARTDKARMLRSVDVYCAPNTGRESFGIILLEAMAAGAPIVASDLDAFRRVLDGGRAGQLFRTGDAGALARGAGRRCSTTRPGGSGWPTAAPRRWPPYDWRGRGQADRRGCTRRSSPGRPVRVSPDTSATLRLVGE